MLAGWFSEQPEEHLPPSPPPRRRSGCWRVSLTFEQHWLSTQLKVGTVELVVVMFNGANLWQVSNTHSALFLCDMGDHRNINYRDLDLGQSTSQK